MISFRKILEKKIKFQIDAKNKPVAKEVDLSSYATIT